MRRLTYPKEARIRRRTEFLELQHKGRRRHTAHLVVIRRPGAHDVSRLGVTVSRRVGNAVARNRVKRVLREVFRVRRIHLNPPVDVLVIAKPGADCLSHAQAAIEFCQAIDSSGTT